MKDFLGKITFLKVDRVLYSLFIVYIAFYFILFFYEIGGLYMALFMPPFVCEPFFLPLLLIIESKNFNITYTMGQYNMFKGLKKKDVIFLNTFMIILNLYTIPLSLVQFIFNFDNEAFGGVIILGCYSLISAVYLYSCYCLPFLNSLPKETPVKLPEGIDIDEFNKEFFNYEGEYHLNEIKDFLEFYMSNARENKTYASLVPIIKFSFLLNNNETLIKEIVYTIANEEKDETVISRELEKLAENIKDISNYLSNKEKYIILAQKSDIGIVDKIEITNQRFYNERYYG